MLWYVTMAIGVGIGLFFAIAFHYADKGDTK